MSRASLCLFGLAAAGCGELAQAALEATAGGMLVESSATSSGQGQGPGESSVGFEGGKGASGATDDASCVGQPGFAQVYRGTTRTIEPIGATCRGEGRYIEVYVEDALWGSTITQEAVDAFLVRLELRSPPRSYDPNQGVIANNVEIFGGFSSAVTGKVALYIVDMAGAGDGYVCGWCDEPEIHLDGVGRPLAGDESVAVAAHESYHVMHLAYDVDEVQWVDESLAQAVMTMNGLFTDGDWVDEFLRNPDQNWGPGSPEGFGRFQYGAGLLWGSLLWERGGPELLAAITIEPDNGWAGIDRALATLGYDQTGWGLYQDLMVAIYLDDPSVGYGFTWIETGHVTRLGDLGEVGDTRRGAVLPYGIDYWRLTGEGARQIGLRAPQEVTALAVVAGDDVRITTLRRLTEVQLDVGSTAFVAVTSVQASAYELTLE